MHRFRRKKICLIILFFLFLVSYYWLHAPNVPTTLPLLTDNTKGGEKKYDADSISLIYTKEEMKIREEGYHNHSFNILASDRIGYHRTIPDTRDNKCVKKVRHYNVQLTASIIICFYNEAWSTLLRTIYSVIDRTPSYLMKEIILINDRSNMEHLKHRLTYYVQTYLPVVKLYQTNEREGLVRARLKGASHATGDVLVFLDSHCEVNKNWLEPLVDRIHHNRKTVVCPMVDIINAHTFEYTSSFLVRGGFNWGMQFNWDDLPAGHNLDASEPFISPTMSGGLFAISRNYFYELGSYDMEMDVWGSENLEISFRIWMCGGRLEIIPCSRVGHIFRERRPYGNDNKGDVESNNAVRLVEVWLDEYKKHFYALRPDLEDMKVNVSDRILLRKRLKCKSFKWYLDVIYPELPIPLVRDGAPLEAKGQNDSPTRDKGKLQNLHYHNCLDTMGDPLKKMSSIVLRNCRKTMMTRIRHTWDDQLQITKKLCIDTVVHTHTKVQVRTAKCHGSKSGQEWRFRDTLQIYNPSLGMCLAGNDRKLVVTQICDSSSDAQKWNFLQQRT